MELAKVSDKGQVTIPADIRKKLNLRAGDKLLFVEEGGNVRIENATMYALKEVQEAFAGAAEEAGLRDEEDVVAYLKAFRRERTA